MYTDIVRNITISVDDDLWKRIRDSASESHISMNKFIGEALSRAVMRSEDSPAARIAAMAERIGPAPKAWTWNRDEIYEDAINGK